MSYSSNPIAKTRDSRSALFLIALMVGGTFLLDWATPLGYAVWLLYAIPLLLTAWTARRGYAYGLALLCTLLIVAGAFLSPPGASVSVAIFNRLLGISVLWTTAALLERRKQAEEALRQLTEELEQRVAQRTAALRESQALLRAFAEGIPDPLYVKDRESRIIMANPALAAVVGKPLEEILGRTDGEYYGDAAVGQALRESDLRVMASGRSEVTEETVPTPLGDHTFLSTKAPHRDAAGHIIGIIGVSRDITERKQAERERERLHAEMTQQARFLSAFLDNAPSAMAYLDTGLRFVRVNHVYAEWTGLPAEQLVGRTHFDVWGIEERVETMRQVLETGEPVRRPEMPLTYPGWLNRPEGCVDYAVFPVRDEAGRVAGLVLSVEDATERVSRREQLLSAERARAELAENLNREIAHRVKNNLAMVAGLLQVQMARQRTPETTKALSDAISRVLTFASIQQEMQAGAEGWVDLLPILRRVGAASSGALSGMTVVVSVTGDAVPLPSKAATNLAVAANELVTNAIKHGAPGPDGKLRVDVMMHRTDDGRSLRLCVWNSGNPVPEGFDPGEQPGMGLQLVRDLAAGQYHGTLNLKPETGGTLAEVIVPLEELQKG